MFKTWLKKLIVAGLMLETKLVVRRYRPRLVGITGNVGKTTTKDLIACVLRERYALRASEKSYNSELGLPLTVLGLPNAWSSFWGWLTNLVRGAWLALGPRQVYPSVLILEVGLDRPGDIKRVAELVKFDVVVLTRLPATPVHVEFFTSVEELVREKLLLVSAVKPEGVVVLNGDDEAQTTIQSLTPAKRRRYGFGEGADYRVGEPVLIWSEDRPPAMRAELRAGDELAPLTVPGLVAREQWLLVAAAAAVAGAFHVPLAEVVGELKHYVGPPGRLKLLPGVKNSLIIDDSYNSSPAALEAALEALRSLPTNRRRIAVIGDMLELGEFTAAAHEAAGAHAARVCDIIIGVGLRAKFLLEAAAARRVKPENLHHFEDALAAGKWLQNEIQSGDVILVKGSQSVRLERTVEEIMAEPDRKAELLVRQDKEWLKK